MIDPLSSIIIAIFMTKKKEQIDDRNFTISELNFKSP